MTDPFRAPPARRLAPLGAALLALLLAGCAGEPAPSAATTSAATSATTSTATSTAPASEAPSSEPAPGPVATSTPAPSGNDVAPYDDTATRDAAARFGATQPLGNGLEAVVEGPRPATAGERAVRAAPGTPVQVFTVTLTNTGSAPVDAVPWSFPVAVHVDGGDPALPAFDESLGVRMETFPTIAPGGSASLDVAFSAPAGADLAVRVFDNSTPNHFVEFTA
ncbi:hypothetical protein GCM10011374_00240 [Kocuria dechangensis]|uniref:DUF4352 domain-containing protein n=1 Tax=Kocuria dechangensis TaxID=1176249 RepID=A0A917LLF5_9MICC|nr:hypothetical protein [Kocuria dechangensis]GGG41846.1 hypothetical protein GCM10011374_00240 [Kocuria dechangensis]